MNLERNAGTGLVMSPILRVWSALTAFVAFSAVLVGTLVTTFHVGMTDPLWPTAPWHLLLIERVPNFGFYVEHTHRIVGYAIGICILVQTLAYWWTVSSKWRRFCAFAAVFAIAVGTGIGMKLVRSADVRSIDAMANPGFILAFVGAIAFLAIGLSDLNSRTAGRWQRFFAVLLFLGVICQGLLGGTRVYLNELFGSSLALIHGILAQCVFALACLLAMMSTREWNSLSDVVFTRSVQRLSHILAGTTFVQIFFGGLLRHLDWPLAARLHPLMAFAVVLAAVLMIHRIFTTPDGTPALRRLSIVMAVLLAFQIVFGLEAFVRAANPELRLQTVTLWDAAIRSTHVLIGFGIFATSVLMMARTRKARLI
jgi:heme A synthase